VLYFNNWNIVKGFDQYSDLIGLLFSIIGIILAIKLYDRFGLNKKLTEKRTDLLIELLNIIKTNKFVVESKYPNGESTIRIIPKKGMVKFYGDALKNGELELFVLFNSQDNLKYTKTIILYTNNLILPKAIASKMNFLLPNWYSYDKNRSNYNVKLLYSDGRKIINDEKKWYWHEDSPLTLREYLTNYENLLVEIENWINKHSNLTEDLNI